MSYLRKNNISFRVFLIKLWVLYCFFIFASTEFLSLFDLIDRKVFALVYFISFVFLIFYLWKNKAKVKFEIKPYSFWLGYIILSVVVFVPLLLIALYYPPNNWDSMTYHLPRVEHWIQNKNVEFYPTNNSRQLFLSPMAEYIILHWRILVGEDNLVNLVQYFSMILSVITATLVVKQWRGNKFAELSSAVLVATIPMGIMQSTSTQNDYVTAFFAIASLFFYLKSEYLFLAISIGLGIFTKSTFIVFVLPLGFYWFLTWLQHDGLKAWKPVFLILIFTVFINGAQWYRNYKYFGSIFGPVEMSEAMFNTSFAPKYIISNVVRNFGTQIGLPNTSYNLKIDDLVENIHQKLGIKSNDFVNTWYSEKYNTQFSIHEDLSGNFVLFVLIIATGVILLFKKSTFRLTYLILLFGWFLFNFLFKWQPWQSRLELPFFVMICPVVVMVIHRHLFTKIYLYVCLIILLVTSLPFIFGYLSIFSLNSGVTLNSNRMLKQDIFSSTMSRYEVFLNESPLNIGYDNVTLELKGLNIQSIGLDLGSDSREYPLWVALRHNFEYSNVNIIHSLEEKVVISDSIDLVNTFDKESNRRMFYFENVGVIVNDIGLN